MKILGNNFYNNDTQWVAQNLLGKFLVRTFKNRQYVGIITETEAYLGTHDKASHSCKGRTARTETMFGPAGHWYVYLVYGMYHCLNIVTEKEGNACAVLIRGVWPITGLPATANADGPGKLCKVFEIDRHFNSQKAFDKKTGLFIANGINLEQNCIKKAKRIGIDYAGEKWKNRLLRFYIKNPQKIMEKYINNERMLELQKNK